MSDTKKILIAVGIIVLVIIIDAVSTIQSNRLRELCSERNQNYDLMTKSCVVNDK